MRAVETETVRVTCAEEKRASFEAEALPHLESLYRLALRLAGDPTRAEDLVQETVLKAYRAWIVTVQNPVTLDRRSQPQPDLAVVRRRPEFFGHATPTYADTLLIIEVADSSVEYDREIKIPLYARAGIPEVWLCDLPGDVVEVHRAPEADGYRDVGTLRRGETVTALHLPFVTLAVADVLG